MSRTSASRPPNSAEAESLLRKTGFPILGELPWGGHICIFYETKVDLLDLHRAYFKAGLENNESCIWAISEPIALEDALSGLRAEIPNFDRFLADGRIEIVSGHEWYLKGTEFDLQRITAGWRQKLVQVLAKGRSGLRVSGNAFWLQTDYWNAFHEYELDKVVSGQRMIVLCTYQLTAARAIDLLDVARAHQFTIARRGGNWEFIEAPDLSAAKLEIIKLKSALGALTQPIPGGETLTARERAVLAQIVRGASSKEAGRLLGISPRTVEFHRANILQKLGAKNTADLVRMALGE